MTELPGSAVNDCVALLARFETSDTSRSTVYVIAYGRAASTLTFVAVFPAESSVSVCEPASLLASGCSSGQNHCRPKVKSSHPEGERIAGTRVTCRVADAPLIGAPNK